MLCTVTSGPELFKRFTVEAVYAVFVCSQPEAAAAIPADTDKCEVCVFLGNGIMNTAFAVVAPYARIVGDDPQIAVIIFYGRQVKIKASAPNAIEAADAFLP